nr:MAG TPA: Terminase large subunit [Caudoviricetes sp.]
MVQKVAQRLSRVISNLPGCYANIWTKQYSVPKNWICISRQRFQTMCELKQSLQPGRNAVRRLQSRPKKKLRKWQMATKSNIYKDPRWLSLVEKYKDNWVLAAKELFDIDLSHQQQQIVEAIQPNNAKATVTTPHGIGRPQVLAVISTLYTIMYPDSRTVIVYPKSNACKKGIVAYVWQCWEALLKKQPFIIEYFKVGDSGLMFNEFWGMCFCNYRLNYEDSIAGHYADHLLFIIVDSAHISDRAYSIVWTSMTSGDSRILLTSIPSPEEIGFFYDSHHGRALAEDNPSGVYKAIKLSAEDSPFITQEYLDHFAERYGGRNSDDYRRMILGEFPGIREAVLESDMPKTMRFSMPDGSEWTMPLRVIAKHHAQHHAKKHGVTTLEWLKSHTIPLFTADHNAIVEWAKTIPWGNVAEYAHMLKPPKDRQEISWLTAEKIIE